MYFKAFDFLVGEFLASKGFPFFLPDPNVIVAKTMKKLWIHMRGINNFEKDDEKEQGLPDPNVIVNKTKKLLKHMREINNEKHDEEQGEKKVIADV